MGRQIRFFLCPAMRTAIETEAYRLGAVLVSSNAFCTDAIEFSTSSGTDTHQGRLWTEAADSTHYELLSRLVKKASAYDRESGLWVKRISRAAFDAYRAEQKHALSELVARNKKHAVEVLGAKLTSDEG
jgi:hypothetical protein